MLGSAYSASCSEGCSRANAAPSPQRTKLPSIEQIRHPQRNRRMLQGTQYQNRKVNDTTHFLWSGGIDFEGHTFRCLELPHLELEAMRMAI